jgi:hypothetical protein
MRGIALSILFVGVVLMDNTRMAESAKVQSYMAAAVALMTAACVILGI